MKARVPEGYLPFRRVPVKFSKPPLPPPSPPERELLPSLVGRGWGRGKEQQCLLKQTLFLPAAGNRNNANGALNNVGTNGNYWSSTTSSSLAYNLNFNSTLVSPAIQNYRGNGFSVRCVQNLTQALSLILKQMSRLRANAGFLDYARNFGST